MTRPEPSPRLHASHDPSLIAAYAAGDAAGLELAEAVVLVADCAECAALHRDLRAIATALPVMQAPRRTHDFRITAEEAAALRPRGLARLLAPLASARFAFAGPAGAGLAALGLVGILLSGGLGQNVQPTSMAAPAAPAAPVENSAAGAGPNTPTLAAPPADSSGGVTSQVAPLASDRGPSTVIGGADESPAPKQALASDARLAASPEIGAAPAPARGPMAPASPAGIPPVTLVASLLLVGGLVLGGMRVLARRIV
jgi:hypothetical protein